MSEPTKQSTSTDLSERTPETRPPTDSATVRRGKLPPAGSNAWLGTITLAEFLKLAENMPAETIHFDIVAEEKEEFWRLIDSGQY